MNKKVARYGLFFCLTVQLLNFFFPKQIMGNIYIVIIYMLITITFLFFIFYKRQRS